MSNKRRTYEGHELFKLENFEEGEPFENHEGTMFFFRDFLFESIYHTIDAWYHNFKKKVIRLDISERRFPYRQESYIVHMGERQFDDFKITFRRCEDGEEVEIKVRYETCESIFTDINVAVGFMIHCIGFSLRKWNEKIKERDARLFKNLDRALGDTFYPEPKFTVTDKPCNEMWNPTSHCIVRTGENICVSCNKEIKEKENEADVSRPDSGRS